MSDGPFAQFETSFILNDPRLDELTGTQRWCYTVLWCYAVETRKDVTKFRNIVTNMSQLCRINPRTCQNVVAVLQQNCLIDILDKNTIRICGVKRKHPRLKWKETGSEPTVRKAEIVVEKSRVEKSRVDDETPKWKTQIEEAYQRIDTNQYKCLGAAAVWEAKENFINKYEGYDGGRAACRTVGDWQMRLMNWLKKDNDKKREEGMRGK